MGGFFHYLELSTLTYSEDPEQLNFKEKTRQNHLFCVYLVACFLAGVKVGLCLPGAVLSCQVGPELLGRDLPLSFGTASPGL